MFPLMSNQPSEYKNTDIFSPTTYTGNGSALTITNGIDLSTKGGFVWTKDRVHTFDHVLMFTDLGLSKQLNSNKITSVTTNSSVITSWNTTGYTLGTDTTTNTSNDTFISWCCRKAPGFCDTLIYTGNSTPRTISHNLGAVPEMIFIKRTDANANWVLYHVATGNSAILNLKSISAVTTGETAWNYTTPTSTDFSIYEISVVSSNVNVSGGSYLALLFGSKAGISECFSYTGNGASQTINCGFSSGARFILLKRTDNIGLWYMWDSARGIVSANDPYVLANNAAVEVTTNDSIDPDSMGFIVNQNSTTNINVNGASYIGLAIA